jgi:hypothetical protein
MTLTVRTVRNISQLEEGWIQVYYIMAYDIGSPLSILLRDIQLTHV